MKFDEELKTQKLKMPRLARKAMKSTKKEINTLATKTTSDNMYRIYWGVLQNSILTREEKIDLWRRNPSEYSITLTLWATNTNWDNTALELLLRIPNYINLPENNYQNFIKILSQYPHWTQENCHLLAKVIRPSGVKQIQNSSLISDEVKILIGLLT